MPKPVAFYSEGVKLGGRPDCVTAGTYEVYAGEALRQVMDATLAWYAQYLPAR